MRIIFVRHGQTTWNIESRYQGHSDTDLSDAGRLQAVQVADRLESEEIAAVYSSDLRRASDTASMIADRHDLRVQTDPRLRECEFGEWEGLTVTEIRERYAEIYRRYQVDSVNQRAPRGERLESLVARVGEAVDEIAERHPEDTVVIAGHGGTVHAAICYMLGASLYTFRKIRIDNCSITSFSLDANGRWVLDAMNDVCHLQ